MQDAARDISPMPLLAWRQAEEELPDFQGAPLDLATSRMAAAEWAYHCAQFPEAIQAANDLLEDATDAQRVAALSLKLRASMAMGDSNTAYPTLVDLQTEINRGFRHPENLSLFNTSVICAHIVESAVSIFSDDIPELGCPLDELPPGWQVYCGFQMAAREFARGRLLEAMGMIRGFMSFANDRYPIPCIKLHLTSACIHLRLHDPVQAVEEWQAAWRIAKPLGVLAPFMELNAHMPGLSRRCLKESDPQVHRLLKAMVRSHRFGWSGVRRQLKATMPGEALSDLEYYVSILVAWGWSNRQIASFLGIAESTVKHYLTSVYQKFGISGRAQLVEYLLGQPETVRGLILRVGK